MNEHSPIPYIQESAPDVAISKQKATELTPVVASEIQNLCQVLPHTNEQNSGRERAPVFTSWWATTPQCTSNRLWAMPQLVVSGFHSQPKNLGQEAHHTPLYCLHLAIQLAIKSKTPEIRGSLERHNSLKLADTWQHRVLSPSLASVSLFLPTSLSPGLSVISYSIMKISKTPSHFFKVTIQYRFELALAGPC